MDGKKVVNLASNNYLGLADHPKVKQAKIEPFSFLAGRTTCTLESDCSLSE